MISTPTLILRRLVALTLIPSLMLDPRWAAAAMTPPETHAAAIPWGGRLLSEALTERAEPFNGFTRVFAFPQRADLLRSEGKVLRGWVAVVGWGFRHPLLSLVASLAVTVAFESLWPGSQVSWWSRAGHAGQLYAMNFLTGIPLNLLPKGSGKLPVVLCSLYDDPQSAALTRLNAKLVALSRAEPNTETMAALRTKIKTYLARDMGVASEALPDIYFLNPPGGKMFFQDGNAYGAVHFNAQAIYFSLPILRALQDREDQDEILQDIAIHIAAHLQNESHSEAAAYEQTPEKLNKFLRALWEEQMEFEDPEPETPPEEGWTPEQKSLLDTVVRIPQSAPPYSGYNVLLKTKKKVKVDAVESEQKKRADKKWFEETIVSHTQKYVRKYNALHRDAPLAEPSTYEEAYALGWRWELSLYPFEKGQCAFGHSPNWVFNWIHDDTRTLIPVGPEEVLTFGLLSPAEKKAAQKKIRDPNIQANDEETYLRTGLTLLQQPSVLKALL